MNIRIVAAALLLAMGPIAGGARPAFAQQSDDATTKAARARFQEGVEFYDKGQYENARAAFLQAYALRKHPAVLLNLAQSSLRSGHAAEAAKFFAQYLHESTSLTASQRADAEKGLADARLKLGHVEVTAAPGTEISVDGDRIGVAPLPEPIDVEPGSHKIAARATDGTTDTKSVTLGAGQQVTARFGTQTTATAPPVAPPPTSPAEAPPTTPEKPPSTPSDEPGAAHPSEPKASHSSRNMTPAIIGGLVGGAGVITAIAFAIGKSNAESKATNVANLIEHPPDGGPGGTQGTCFNPPPGSRFYSACNTLTSDNNQINGDATAANVGVAVGIAGAVFAIGWLIFAPKHEEGAPPTPATTTSFAPLLGPHLSGLGASGSF